MKRIVFFLKLTIEFTFKALKKVVIQWEINGKVNAESMGMEIFGYFY